MSYIQKIRFPIFHKNLLKQYCKEHNLSPEECIKQAVRSNDKVIRMRALFAKILLSYYRNDINI